MHVTDSGAEYLRLNAAPGTMMQKPVCYLDLDDTPIRRHELRHVRNERSFTITPTTRFKWEAIDSAEAQAGPSSGWKSASLSKTRTWLRPAWRLLRM